MRRTGKETGTQIFRTITILARLGRFYNKLTVEKYVSLRTTSQKSPKTDNNMVGKAKAHTAGALTLLRRIRRTENASLPRSPRCCWLQP